MMSRVFGWLIVAWLAAGLLCTSSRAADKAAEVPADCVPVLGQFPPAGVGHYFAGELVVVDPINRRGGLRLDGDSIDDRYDKAPLHQFALLPYGEVWYHGAPAELRDVPTGTHLHGYFVLPPTGDTSVPPPVGAVKYVPKYNHALVLEDDFSYYQKRGQAWKILSVDIPNGKIKVEATGSSAADGLQGEVTFDLDRSTRIWQGRESVELENLATDQVVQCNLTWAPDWRNKHFHAADIWIDQKSRDVTTERQRQIHLRYQHHRWLAGWIESVEHQKNGHGILTITLFSGMDPELYEEVKRSAGLTVAVAEPTLRSWWQDHDSKGGRNVEVMAVDNPPPGHSGIQVRVQIGELLEGFRPARIVRMRANSWPNVKLPPEERVRSLDIP